MQKKSPAIDKKDQYPLPQKKLPHPCHKSSTTFKKKYFFRLFIYLKKRFYVMGKKLK